MCFVVSIGVLLNGLFVGEDLAVAKITRATSHAATMANTSNVQAGRLPRRYGFVDERTKRG